MGAGAIRVPFLDLKAQYASIRDEILETVHEVLESAHYVGGAKVEQFEEEFARYAGSRYAVATASGTAALELVMRALGLGAGDEVIVPANSFFATAEAVSNIGATPVFADVQAHTFHLDASSVERCITPRSRAIVPVHLYGRAMDLTEIVRLAEDRGLMIAEDACQGHGAELNGIRVGGSGRPACFSFYPGKNLGAYGDDGAVTCNDAGLARSIRILRDHGSPSKYQHLVVGTNARLDAIQAAVLSVKLRRLDDWNRRRMRHAATYLRGLKGTDLILPWFAPKGAHNYHLFVVRTAKRDALRAFLAERGIETGIHYPVPIHLTPAYQALGYPGPGSLPVVERLGREVLSLPMYAELTREQVREVIVAVQDFATVTPEPVVVRADAHPQVA
jgi:dTDP-3-amino-3,4,6-trideoxy-alpha-D-glucose transaminase